MTDHEDLLTTIDRLTKPYSIPTEQANAAGITCLTVIEHDGLLQQLRDAIAGNTTGRGGANLASARERIPLDPGALHLHQSITRIVTRWLIRLGQRPRDPENLEQIFTDWYLAHELERSRGKIDDHAHERHASILRGWAAEIESKFNPPRVMELTMQRKLTVRRLDGTEHEVTITEPAHCPAIGDEGHVCDAQYVWDRSSGDRSFALVVEYWELGAETLSKAVGRCRFCGTEWRGEHGVRMLMQAVGEHEKSLDTRADTPIEMTA